MYSSPRVMRSPWQKCASAAHGRNGERRRIAHRHSRVTYSLREPLQFHGLRLASSRVTTWKRISLIRGWSLPSSNLRLRLTHIHIVYKGSSWDLFVYICMHLHACIVNVSRTNSKLSRGSFSKSKVLLVLNRRYLFTAKIIKLSYV